MSDAPSNHPVTSPQNSRRNFLKGTTAAAVAGAISSPLTIARSAHAAGGDVLRLGLIGCGGRGNGAAVQALKADKYTRLTAMGDLFPEQLTRAAKLLKDQQEVADRVDVPEERQFSGFDAYQKVIDSGVDVILLGTPPHFRPLHLQAAVDAGKHVFAEKPVAVDAQGVRKVLATVRQAKEKGLSICSGLCWRYENTARATIAQINEGLIGDVIAIEANYYSSPPGKAWPMPRDPAWSDMEYQIRNWYWFTWLSGDHIVEQAVHSVDKASWILRDVAPETCIGVGGLQARTAPDRGQIFDHHAVNFEYASGVGVHFNCTQQVGTVRDVSVTVRGTKGVAVIEKGAIRSRGGESLWRYRGPKNVMHQTEHDELFAALRAGKQVTDGEYMAHTTMLAIMGRMATYTGQKLTWDQAFNSKENLTPAKYEWGPGMNADVAVPGVTPLV
ncbi:MAG: Gfo/Idh/MocA family oxidoreductase [Planctomycetes bacterium]|nr:Gfo/Idh/MocA family oxidoreductase [Planctomycetota bacterium]